MAVQTRADTRKPQALAAQVNTHLAGAAGGVASLLANTKCWCDKGLHVSYVTRDLSLMRVCGGVLAGLVAISAVAD